MTEISRDLFLENLHEALIHLYNTDQLRNSPLADLFGVSSRFNASSALRKILSDAIDGFKPPSSEPDTSRAWRTYESLYCCFIQQLNQQVVADQLCISPRQLRREQHNAIEQLADALWQKYQLDRPAAAQPGGEPAASSPLIEELSWLVDGQPLKANRLSDEIQQALEVLQHVAENSGVVLRSQVSGNLPGLAVHSVALHQILVSLLDLAIHEAGGAGNTGGAGKTGGELPGAAPLVTISARALPVAVEVKIQVSNVARIAGASPKLASSDATSSLEIATELARISGGRLYTAAPEGLFPIRLILPALEQFPVLVIDDNEDSLQLMKRYAVGTRYHVVCTRDTEMVITLYEQVRPRIIVLDIMMPRENGWIVLGRLRQHPLTSETPVIICTILPQEKLALSLGASAYLKKPVSRQAFLQSLDEQFALLEPEYT
ncbi:MAG TPA: response regulator [Anaerolineaceae bacterium]